MKRWENDHSFPEDLLIEVLSLLPAESLLRFKCVCKSWYVLLEKPNFVSKNLSNSSNNINDDDHPAILCRDCRNIYSFMSISYKASDLVHTKSGLHSNRHLWDRGQLLGSFNGVLCLFSQIHGEIVFWNPTTRTTKIVPRPTFNALGFRNVFGFGYDFKTNDYNVIVTSTISSVPTYRYDIEVYTLSTDSWRKSKAIIPDGLQFRAYHPSTCIRGTYSVVVTGYDEESKVCSYVLLTFDMSNDVIIATPMPKGMEFNAYYNDYAYLQPLKDSVAIVAFKHESRADWGCFEISVLNEYGPNGLWTKLYTIEVVGNDPNNFPHPLGFWKNNLIFCRNYYQAELVLCDLTTYKLKKIQTDCVLLFLMEYKESITSLNRRVWSW